MKRQFMALCAVATLALLATSVFAADGTWTQAVGLGPFNWSVGANWDAGTVADGADSTATFNVTPDTNGQQVVNVNTSRTIGNITFSSTNRKRVWNISGTDVLTMDVTTGTPTVSAAGSWSGNGDGSIISAVIAGDDGLAVTGTRPVHLTGANTYTGGTTVDGILLFGSAGSIPGSGRTITVNNGGAVGSDYNMDNAFLNRIVENTNTFTILINSTNNIGGGANTTNDLDFSSSTGANLSNASLGSWSGGPPCCEDNYSGTLTPNGNTYRLGGGEGYLGFSGPLTGAGNSVVITRQTVALTNAGNDYGGGTTITDGGILNGDDVGTGSMTLDDGTWQNPGANPTVLVVLGAGGGTIYVDTPNDAATTLGGVISGSGDLTLRHRNGTHSSPGASEKIILGVANTYTGNTTMTNVSGQYALLQNGVANALPTTTELTMDALPAGSGRLVQWDLDGNDQTLAGLISNDGGSAVSIISNSSGTFATLTVNNDTDNTFKGQLGTSVYPTAIVAKPFVLGDNFGLTKGGAGKLTLDPSANRSGEFSDNSYTGDTIVNAGTLSITTPYLADAADVYLTTGAALELDFDALTPDTIDQLIIDGSAVGAGTWGANGSGAPNESLLLEGTGLLIVTSGPLFDPDLNGDGAVNDQDLQLVLSGLGSTYPQDNLDAVLDNYGKPPTGAAEVPEPGSMVLLLLGALGLLGLRRQK